MLVLAPVAGSSEHNALEVVDGFNLVVVVHLSKDGGYDAHNFDNVFISGASGNRGERVY